ncbi:MAG: glycosyltransferase [Eubacteriales bacterium]|nr:glycosyltransferase [Eubacteriales bacterium]
MTKIYAYLPCYNEEQNIEKLICAWLATEKRLNDQGYALCVIPVDDKSSDSTLSIIRRLENEYEAVRVIANKQNQNLGGVLGIAIQDFLKHATGNDLLCFMDGDNTHDPIYIFDLLDAIKGKDCAIASRYRTGAKVYGVPQHRLFFSYGARVYYSLVLHVPHVRDYTCGYRLYRREILEKANQRFGDELVSMKTFSCMMELLYKLYLCGCRFVEVPFVLRYDEKGGSSKMNVVKTTCDSISLALKLRSGKKG